jgi:UDP-2,3-diacylglucosamine hydrolase
VNSASPGTLHVWTAPPHWRSVDFISDLHLAPELPQTVAAWQQVLQHGTADAVCLLGDVFERWVGDDSRFQPFEQALVGMLAAAAASRPLASWSATATSWSGPTCAAAGMTGLPDPTVLQAWGGNAGCCAMATHSAWTTPATRPSARRCAAAPGSRPFWRGRWTNGSALPTRCGARASATQADMLGTDLDADACRQLLRQAGARR